jgi:Ni,Fe-hydrogenase III small subunit
MPLAFDTLRLRGGTPALSAADADTLVLCGALSASLGEVVGRLWGQVPVPRTRVRVLNAGRLTRRSRRR